MLRNDLGALCLSFLLFLSFIRVWYRKNKSLVQKKNCEPLGVNDPSALSLATLPRSVHQYILPFIRVWYRKNKSLVQKKNCEPLGVNDPSALSLATLPRSVHQYILPFIRVWYRKNKSLVQKKFGELSLATLHSLRLCLHSIVFRNTSFPISE